MGLAAPAGRGRPGRQRLHAGCATSSRRVGWAVRGHVAQWRPQTRRLFGCGGLELRPFPTHTCFRRLVDVGSRQKLTFSGAACENSWSLRLGAVLSSPGEHPFARDRGRMPNLEDRRHAEGGSRAVSVFADRARGHRWVTDAGRTPGWDGRLAAARWLCHQTQERVGGERQQAKHAVTHHLRGTTNPDMATAELVLETAIDALTRRTLVVFVYRVIRQ